MPSPDSHPPAWRTVLDALDARLGPEGRFPPTDIAAGICVATWRRGDVELYVWRSPASAIVVRGGSRVVSVRVHDPARGESLDDGTLAATPEALLAMHWSEGAIASPEVIVEAIVGVLAPRSAS